MIIFGVIQIIFSQIPDFDQIWWLSIVAAVMSFTYSSIGLGLAIAQVVGKQLELVDQYPISDSFFDEKVKKKLHFFFPNLFQAGNGGFKGSLTGISIGSVTQTEKIWRTLQAFGDIAFAYSYSIILIEIQVLISSENKPKEQLYNLLNIICADFLCSRTQSKPRRRRKLKW